MSKKYLNRIKEIKYNVTGREDFVSLVVNSSNPLLDPQRLLDLDLKASSHLPSPNEIPLRGGVVVACLEVSVFIKPSPILEKQLE